MNWVDWLEVTGSLFLIAGGLWMINQGSKALKVKDYPSAYWYLAYVALIVITLK